MREVFRLLRIRDVDQRRSVGLWLAGQCVRLRPAMMTDVGNPPVSLFVDRRLIGAAALQITVSDKLHIALVGLLLRTNDHCGRDRREKNKHDWKVSFHRARSFSTLE